MLSSSEIKKIKFSKAMSGYKTEEVEIFLDKIFSDLTQYERIIAEFQTKIESLNNEIEDMKASQNSIQSVLVSAQRLADDIVREAKVKSEEIIKNAEANITLITEREKEISSGFEYKAQERKTALEKEINEMLRNASLKADSITAAAEDSVARQQILFDKLKLEISTFKSGIISKYKEHLESLSSIPDSVPSDPKTIAKIVAAEFDKAPDVDKYLKPEYSQPSIESDIKDNEELLSDAEVDAQEVQTHISGFSVDTDTINFNDDIEE